MAMRRFIQFVYGFEKKQVRLFCKATVGASGAITISRGVNDCQGILSITKQATAGQYTIKFGSAAGPDTYYKLLKATCTTINATGIATAGSTGIVSGATNVTQAGGGVVTYQLSSGGTATNPASGDVLLFEIVLGDSNA